MAVQLIKRIRKAEEEADQTIRDAEKEAQKIVLEADKKNQETVSAASQAARIIPPLSANALPFPKSSRPTSRIPPPCSSA